MPAQLGLQLGLRVFLGLGGDRAEQPELVFRQQVDRAVRQRVALVAPEVPADVGVNVVGLEADRLRDTRMASGRTWLPMPSPGMVTTVCFAIISS